MGNYVAQEQNNDDNIDYNEEPPPSDDDKQSDKEKSIDTIWTFETNKIQSHDMQQMSSILHDYCKQTINTQANNDKLATADTMTFICALSKKYKMPLVEWLLSTYYRTFIDHYVNSGNDYDIKQFIKTYPFFRHYNNKSKPVLFNQLTMIIDICHVRLFSKPSLNQITYKICDKYDEYIEIVSSFDRFIQMNTQSNEDSLLNALPLQIDLWIVPNKVENVNDLIDHKQIEVPQDIEAELNLCSKLKEKNVYCYERNSSSYISWYETFKIVFREACKQFAKEKLERYKRYVMIIDRRQEVVSIYFFKAPKGTKIPKEYYQYLTVINFCYSKKVLLPKQDGRDIGAYHRLYNMFCLSYHMKAANNISVYWCFNGSQLRFYPIDMINIWPKFFGFEMNANEMTTYKNKLGPIFRDERFEKFYEITTKQQLSVLQPIKQTKIEEKTEQTIDALCIHVRQQFEAYPNWTDSVNEVIQIIDDEFEDLEQIRDDIEEPDDSNLLTTSDDVSFNAELLKVFQIFLNN
eukprot:504600_1